MTEREPDHLFEELRRKLEDYGSAPSDALWAGLEQHLATQPAPARRWRRPGFWLAAACLLLLIGIPAALWLRPATPQVATAAGPHQPPTTAATAKKPDGTAAPALPKPAGQAASLARLKQLAAAPQPTAATAPTSAAVPPAQPAAAGSDLISSSAPVGRATPAGSSAGPLMARPTRRKPAALASGANPALVPAATPAHAAASDDASATRRAAGRLAGRSRQVPSAWSLAARPNRPTSGTAATQAVESGRGRTKAQPAATQAQATTQATSTASGRPTATKSAPALHQETGITPTPLAATPPPAASGRETSVRAANGRPSSTDAATAAPAAPDVNPAATTSSTPAASTVNPLTTWPAALRLADAALPAPLSGVAVDTTRRRLQATGRWSLALLGGAGLAYRQLGPGRDSAGRGLSRLERPAVGYAAQLQLGYAATPRLQLSAGLGYVEYATRFNAVLNKPRIVSGSSTQKLVYDNGTRRDTLVFVTRYDSVVGTDRVALRQRDTYRYLTVPLQARYRLGSTGRLRYDVLGGAALGLYAGGRTSVGSACACEQVAGGTGPGQLRVASLLLTLGAAAEYEWRPGWHLQLQPVLQYSATSITQSPRPARRPVALFLQTGLRFDLP